MGKRRVRLQIDADELLIYAAKLVAMRCSCSVSVAADVALRNAWAEEIEEAKRYYRELEEEMTAKREASPGTGRGLARFLQAEPTALPGITRHSG